MSVVSIRNLVKAYRDGTSRRRKTYLGSVFLFSFLLSLIILLLTGIQVKSLIGVLLIPLGIAAVDILLSREWRRYGTLAAFLGTLFGVGLKWLLEIS